MMKKHALRLASICLSVCVFAGALAAGSAASADNTLGFSLGCSAATALRPGDTAEITVSVSGVAAAYPGGLSNFDGFLRYDPNYFEIAEDSENPGVVASKAMKRGSVLPQGSELQASCGTAGTVNFYFCVEPTASQPNPPMITEDGVAVTFVFTVKDVAAEATAQFSLSDMIAGPAADKIDDAALKPVRVDLEPEPAPPASDPSYEIPYDTDGEYMRLDPSNAPDASAFAASFQPKNGASVQVLGRDGAPIASGVLTTGMRVQLFKTDRVDQEFTIVLLGDSTGDGRVNSADALEALKHSVQISALEGAFFQAGDVAADRKINSADALKILRYAVQLIDGLE